MFILRFLLAILALPLLLIAYLLKLLFILFTGFGKIVAEILGGICVIGSILMIIEGDPDAIAGIILGAVICVLPYVGVFIVSLLDYFIAWVRAVVYDN